jgi:N-methylhydantoinase B
LRVECYGLRLGSGGEGAHRGGDGVLRELRALEPCRLSIISERRRHAPQGERGGAEGTPGRNLLNGEPLPGKVTLDLAAGDLISIETPGGGGFGR